ncbi:hypothetical protein D1BOALGB6SA_6776 [Olavius sp. associated proteobacterium Delta 1]|nr:hypothetical protein D1BOALGB6SA_6776 [Olavius sp. associated proteobacterium Delta 1]
MFAASNSGILFLLNVFGENSDIKNVFDKISPAISQANNHGALMF